MPARLSGRLRRRGRRVRLLLSFRHRLLAGEVLPVGSSALLPQHRPVRRCGSDWQGSGCAKGGKVASGLKTVGCCTQDSCGLACADCDGNAWWEYKGAIYTTSAAFAKACNP